MTLTDAIRTKTAFLEELEALCRKHNISIGHEDGHGAFLLSTFDGDYAGWIDSARDLRVTCPTCGQSGKDYNPEGYCFPCYSKVRSRPL